MVNDTWDNWAETDIALNNCIERIKELESEKTMSNLNKRIKKLEDELWKGSFEDKLISLYKVKFSLRLQGYSKIEVDEIIKVLLACEDEDKIINDRIKELKGKNNED